MISLRSQLIELIEKKAIPMEKIGDALSVAKVTPDGQAWRTFISNLLLWLGSLALAFAAMFFIAFNWNEIGRFTKFGIMEALIVLAIIAYCKFDEHQAASKVSLLVATIFLGVLLALYGQTYQTGADPWQLFFNWALLILPWAIIGRYPAIWIVWVMLINISIVLYYQTFRGQFFWFMLSSDTGMLWLVFFFNTLVLVIWEFLVETWRWLSERWAIRLLAMGGGVPINWLVLETILDSGVASIFPGLVWAIWLASLYFVYRKLRPDLFMLAGGCMAVISVSVAFMGKYLLKDSSWGGFLFLALLIIGMGAAAASWLKKVHQELQS